MTDGVETETQDESAVDDAVVAEGQATDQSGVSPWDSWIQEQEISEIAQAPVRAAFKHADGLATKKFQEHAEERKRWEPYDSLGLNEFEPDFLSGALPIMRALEEGGDEAREIVERMARQLGLLENPDDEDLEYDDAEGDLEGVDDDLRERLARTESFVQQQEEQQRRDQAEAYIADAFETVEKDLGRKLTDGETGRIRNLAGGLAHAGVEDPIGAAWKELKSQREDAQKELLDQKRQEPGRVEVGPSAPAARAPRPNGLSLEEQSNDRLRQWMRSNGITD